MATIPNAASLGARAIPQSQRGLASADGSAVGVALQRAGKEFQDLGAEAAKLEKENRAAQDKLETAQASLLYRQELDAYSQKAKENPNDYLNYDKGFADAQKSALEKSRSLISNPNLHGLFDTWAGGEAISERRKIHDMSIAVSTDKTVAHLLDSAEKEGQMQVQSPDLKRVGDFGVMSENLIRPLINTGAIDAMRGEQVLRQVKDKVAGIHFEQRRINDPLGTYNELSAMASGAGSAPNIGADTVKPYSAAKVAEIRALAAKPSEFDPLFEEMGKKYGVDPKELKLRAVVESGLRPKAQGPQGKYGQSGGLMQLETKTAEALGVTDRNDPRQSVEGAAKLLSFHQKKAGGDQSMVDKLYYAGSEKLMGPNTEQYAANLAAVRGGNNYGVRADGTAKGPGFLGELKRPDGSVSTELSVGVNIDGKEIEIPTLVPTLTKPEIASLLAGEKPSDAIMKKAIDHAKQRMADGKSVFMESATQSDIQRYNLSPDIIQNELEKTRAYATVGVREEMKNISDAFALNVMAPESQLLELADKTKRLGMIEENAKVMQFIDTQKRVVDFVPKSNADMRSILNQKKAVLSTNNPDGIREYQALSAVFENKQKMLKENPWGYYRAHNLVSLSDRSILSDTDAAIAERKTQAETINKIEKGSVRLPLIFEDEAEQLNQMAESGKDVGPLLVNIGMRTTTSEKQDIAREISKKNKFLGAAMAMDNPAVANKIILGSKSDGPVTIEKFSASAREKLNGIVGTGEALDNAVAVAHAYYKQRAIENKDINTEVTDKLVNESIAATIGPIGDVSYDGNVSRVVFPAGMDSSQFEDRLAAFDDAALQALGGARDSVNNKIEARYLLQGNRLITVGSGRYRLVNNKTGMPVLNDSSEPLIIDINSLSPKRANRVQEQRLRNSNRSGPL